MWEAKVRSHRIINLAEESPKQQHSDDKILPTAFSLIYIKNQLQKVVIQEKKVLFRFIRICFILCFIFYYPIEVCFLVRDRKDVDLDGRRGGEEGTMRSRGGGNHKQNILCAGKKAFSIKRGRKKLRRGSHVVRILA